MRAQIWISYFFSCQLGSLVILALFHLCLSDQKYDGVLCMDGEREALMQFKHGLIDEADRLASWVGEESDCCRWAGILCDNITGHVHEIHLSGLDGHCDSVYGASYDMKRERLRQQMLRGNLNPSLLELNQLRHLDLSCNNFEGNQIPSFIGNLRNLRYLNLSESLFYGIIPPQIGNLSELRVISLGGLYALSYLGTPPSLLWLSSLRWLRHLDMSFIDLSMATDWFQVINTLPSLVQLHMPLCRLTDSHPYVANLNLTSLAVLDISGNYFDNNIMPQWIFSQTSLVSLDLTNCRFNNLVPNSIYSFHNLTSLKSLHVQGNNFMNSVSVLEGLPRNLISLDIRYCGISSSTLNSLQNLTSLLSLDVSGNQLTKALPNSLGNFCNLREIDLSENDFGGIDLSYLLESLFGCKSPSLESLVISSSGLSGPIPYSVGRLSSLKKLTLHQNRLNNSLPDSIGQLASLEELYIYKNQLSGNLPSSLSQLSKLKYFWFFNNLLTGVVTEAHFVKLISLKSLDGNGNNLTLHVPNNWIPPFQIQALHLNSWGLGPRFPFWLQSQRDLVSLDISNTHISSLMPPETFWRLFPNLNLLDMSHNHIRGSLVSSILAKTYVLYLGSNNFSGKLPSLSNGSSIPDILDLSNNSFVGSLGHLLCSNGVEEARSLNLGNNRLSGVIPECWEKWTSLRVLNMENNKLFGEIPRTLGSTLELRLLNMRGNKISGRLPTSLMSLEKLEILQLDRNELVKSIPSWLGTRLTLLRILNLRSNNLDGNIPHELCNLSRTQILDLAHNNLSGNIPRCFGNFSVLSGKETNAKYGDFGIFFNPEEIGAPIASETLVMKGQEYTYKSILGLLMLLDLSSNNISGVIPIELTALRELQSLNLSRNQLTGRIPEKIGDMKSLQSFDISLNKLYGKLPMSLSSLNFLSSFNVSYNNLIGRVPISTQLQSFTESSYVGNKLCGTPLSDCYIPVEVPANKIDDDEDNGLEWGLIISIVLGFFTGFWIMMAPLIVSKSWRIAYFSLVSKLIKV